MKKGKIRLIPLLFSAVIAAALFFVIARSIFSYCWGFDLISYRHWNHIIEKWKSGWVLHKPKEVMFFIGLLLLLPGYFGTLFLVYVFPLKKILLFPKTFFENRKKAKLQAQSIAAALGPANRQEALAAKKEPEKTIKISSQKLHHIDQLRGKGATAGHTEKSSSVQTNASSADQAAIRFDLWEKLANTLESRKIFILRQMKIGTFSVNLFAITQESLFLLCEGPDEGENWEVDEDASPAVWKTENGAIPSPLRPMVKAKATLQKYFQQEMPEYAGLNSNCCMILDHGNVLNTDTLLGQLEKWDISVLRMGSCKTASLPDTNALIEYIKSQPASSQTLNDAVAVAILDLMETESGE